LPRVQLITAADDGHSCCPKHVQFRDKIKKIGYLMHLVGYLHEDYHDARSLEHKTAEDVYANTKSREKSAQTHPSIPQ
jgi:hypothetical protein